MTGKNNRYGAWLRSKIRNKQGFGILEVVFGVIMLTIMLVGLAQMVVMGFQQQRLDSRDILAEIVIHNVAERLLVRIRDNSANTGTFKGGCGTYPPSASSTPNLQMLNTTPINWANPWNVFMPALFDSTSSAGKCPTCKINFDLDCNDATNVWEGHIWMHDGQMTIASVPFKVFQPGPSI
jgi:type II secretory pathway pseudopilin PulG